MKRIYSFFLVIIICLSISGCTGTQNEKSEPKLSKEELVEQSRQLPINEIEEELEKNIIVAEEKFSGNLYRMYCVVQEIKKDYVVLSVGSKLVDFQAQFTTEEVSCMENGMYINIVGKIASINETEDEDDSNREEYYVVLNDAVYIDNYSYITGRIEGIGNSGFNLKYNDRFDFEEDFTPELDVKIYSNDNSEYNHFSIDGNLFFKDDEVAIKYIKNSMTDKTEILNIEWLENSDAATRMEVEDIYKKATESMNAEDYASAHYYFNSLGKYQDSEEKAKEMLEKALEGEENPILSQMQGYWHNENEYEDACGMYKIEGKSVYHKLHESSIYHSSDSYLCELNDNILSYSKTNSQGNTYKYQWKLVDDTIVYTLTRPDGTVITREYYRTEKERFGH